MAGIPQATLVTIAKTLGVSLTTVHASLSGRGRVSEATREKVCTFAEELGYTPNSIARALRTKHSGNIALVMPTIGNPGIALMLRGIEKYITDHGFNILLACAHGQLNKERELVNAFLGIGVEGLLVYADQQIASADYLIQVVKRVPLVLLENALPHINADLVSVDQVGMGQTAGQALRAHGRCQQAYLLPYPRARGPWTYQRAHGQQQAALEAGDVYWTLLGESSTEDSSISAYTIHTLSAYLDAGGKLDGLFAANDDFAYQAIAALHTLGFRVPEDVAVIGCDNLPGSEVFTVPLTTFQQPMEKVGAKAAEYLLQRIGDIEAIPPRQWLEPASLVIRASLP